MTIFRQLSKRSFVLVNFKFLSHNFLSENKEKLRTDSLVISFNFQHAGIPRIMEIKVTQFQTYAPFNRYKKSKEMNSFKSAEFSLRE
jgi:hypothetical protein